VTPFMLAELLPAFDSCAGAAYGPWSISIEDASLTCHGTPISPCGWQEMARIAAGDREAARWLAVLREDVAHRLDLRRRYGSIWEPTR
jgi:hypothetical protein